MENTIVRARGFWNEARLIDKTMATVTVAIILAFTVIFSLVATGNIGLLIVKSDSMYPAMPAGSLLVFARSSIEDIEVGDTVVFREDAAGSSLVTHRVIDKVYENGAFSLRTKGDSNHRSDEKLVAEGRLMGRAHTVIPSVGRALAYAKTPAGLLVLNLLLALFVVLVVIDRVRLSERMACMSSEGMLVHPSHPGEEERVAGGS